MKCQVYDVVNSPLLIDNVKYFNLKIQSSNKLTGRCYNRSLGKVRLETNTGVFTLTSTLSLNDTLSSCNVLTAVRRTLHGFQRVHWVLDGTIVGGYVVSKR